MDGASRWVIFSKIVLPLAKPAIAVTALFSFMTAWNEFVLAATLLNDERLFTLPVALQRYVGEYQTDWGTFAAGAIITSLPVMALFYALQKNLVGGLTAGAVKGLEESRGCKIYLMHFCRFFADCTKVWSSDGAHFNLLNRRLVTWKIVHTNAVSEEV